MPVLNPYLNFPGTAEEAFRFYKSIFGGEFTMIQRMKETPEASRLSAEEGEKIMHIALPIGKGNTLMASDAIPSMGHVVQAGDAIRLSLEVVSEDEAKHFFDSLSADGKIEVPLQNTFWNATFGMLTDKFGMRWMINYPHKQR